MPGAQEAITLPRHGFGELAAALPFLAVARIAFGPSAEWADRVLSLQPVLSTALICTILFAWTLRLTGSPAWGAVLGLLAGFSTMLWPYAYIGLETTQSLFLLLAALIALETDGPPTWARSLLFAACGAVAVSIKTPSVFLVSRAHVARVVPLRAPDRARTGASPSCRASRVLVVGLHRGRGVGPEHLDAHPVLARSVHGRAGSWRARWISPWQVWSALLSVNKGLLVFCPIPPLAIFRLDVAFARHRRLVTFAVLVLGGQLLGTCMLIYWSDETWGPRYLHSSIAPLVLCLALAKAGLTFLLLPRAAAPGPGRRRRLDRPAGHPLLVWECPFQAAGPTLLLTIENYQYDIDFNHIRFNAQPARVWLGEDRTAGQDLWPPHQKIWYAKNTPPPRFRPRRQAAGPFAVPQPALLQPGAALPRGVFLAALALGTAAWAGSPGSCGAPSQCARTSARTPAPSGAPPAPGRAARTPAPRRGGTGGRRAGRTGRPRG